MALTLLNESAMRLANLVAESLQAHGNSDWYIALLSSALDKGLGVEDALALADELYAANPEDSSQPADDDVQAVLGESITTPTI